MRLNGRQNNLDFLRFSAAFLVIVSHSFALVGEQEPHIGAFSFGALGVATFFIISGFLIAQSWELHPRFSAFILKRALRIIPGLLGVTLFTIFIVGALFSETPVRQYLLDPVTWAYFNNVFIFSIASTLPGLFMENPLAQTVNGSLWTLPFEFMAYIVAAIVATIGIVRHRRLMVGLLVLIVVMNYILLGVDPATKVPLFPVAPVIFLKLFGYFLAGMSCYHLRDKIRLNARFLIVALLLFAWVAATPVNYLAGVFILPYIVLCIGFMDFGRLQNFGKAGDVSYGMYIYAFPIQQVVVAKYPAISPVELIMAATPIIIILSALSWHAIEKPALKLKKHLSPDRYPIKKAESVPVTHPSFGSN